MSLPWSVHTSFALRCLLSAAVLAGALATAPAALASTDQSDWPAYDMLLMNKLDESRPLDARPGFDPFDGTDPEYRCDAIHVGGCRDWLEDAGDGTLVVSSQKKFSRLLGGHGDDVIHAGPWGDVIWGDYKPKGQPTTQVDTLIGGAGPDFIYSSHGTNRISAGGGDDYVKVHFGHGTVDCGSGRDVLYISRVAQRRTTVKNCETVSHKTLGY